MKKTLVVLMMIALAASAMAVTQDDMIVYRSDNWWYMHETEPAPNYLAAAGWGGNVIPSVDSQAWWGLAGDAPMVGDVNGDGISDILVTRDNGIGNYAWYAGHTDPPTIE